MGQSFNLQQVSSIFLHFLSQDKLITYIGINYNAECDLHWGDFRRPFIWHPSFIVIIIRNNQKTLLFLMLLNLF
jgi:hypothetical protein